ncbi:MAG: hypothetical protein AB7I41_18210 [Candidatus Sericytochromatia bacterium]
MENLSDPNLKPESESPLYIELDDPLPLRPGSGADLRPSSETASPLPENLSLLDTPLNFAQRPAQPFEQAQTPFEAPENSPPPVMVVLRQTPPLKLIALVGALLVILLLFPQFLLILRGAFLELLLLVRALIFPLAALGFAILLLHLFYSRRR